MQQAIQQIGELLQQLAEKDRKLRDQTADIGIKRRETDIKSYVAHTGRIKEVGNAQENLEDAGDGNVLHTLINKLATQVAGEQNINEDESEEDVKDFYEPRQAQDGNHYIRHKGMHYQVDVGSMNNAAQ